MNGAQDLGGMMGFGPVLPEQNEPVFHAEWEKTALALTLAAGGLGEWNLDIGRHARETLPPPLYLTASYYEIWIRALIKLLNERGLVTEDEIRAGQSLHPPAPTARPAITAAMASRLIAHGTPYTRPATKPAQFKIGDRIRTKVMNVPTHTRLPRYVRGKIGTITHVHDVFSFPDTNAHRKGENPEWCYAVLFTGPEVWGEGADPLSDISVDCWEPYLEALA